MESKLIKLNKEQIEFIKQLAQKRETNFSESIRYLINKAIFENQKKT